MEKCKKCNGSGIIYCKPQYYGFVTFGGMELRCDKCNGTGVKNKMKHIITEPTAQYAEPTQDAGVCAINAKEKNMNESTPEFQLTICCNNCEKYPYCEDFQRWARNSEGSGVTHYIMTHDSCPTCGQQTGEEYPTTVKKANGIMLCTCCGNKLFVPRLKNKGKDKCE